METATEAMKRVMPIFWPRFAVPNQVRQHLQRMMLRDVEESNHSIHGKQEATALAPMSERVKLIAAGVALSQDTAKKVTMTKDDLFQFVHSLQCHAGCTPAAKVDQDLPDEYLQLRQTCKNQWQRMTPDTPSSQQGISQVTSATSTQQQLQTLQQEQGQEQGQRQVQQGQQGLWQQQQQQQTQQQQERQGQQQQPQGHGQEQQEGQGQQQQQQQRQQQQTSGPAAPWPTSAGTSRVAATPEGSAAAAGANAARQHDEAGLSSAAKKRRTEQTSETQVQKGNGPIYGAQPQEETKEKIHDLEQELQNLKGTVFQQPTYKAYPGKVFKQGQEAQCRNEALAAGLTVYQLPQDVLPVLEVVMAIIYITRVYCSLIFSSVRPQQTPKQRTEYITQYGTGQRLQVLLAKSPSGKLDLTFKTLNNADTKAINDQLTDAQKAEVQKHKEVLTKYFTRLLPVLVKLLDRPINALATIINDPVNKRKMVGEGDEQEMLIEPAQHAAPPQAPHTDFKPMASGLDDGFVFLLACQDFDLVAYMYSHLLMEHAAPYYKNGNPDLPSLTAIATHALLREGTLVQVKAGQLVLFRGNTVHAGTAGRQDSCGARLYGFGKTGQPADNTTVNMSQLGAVFEGLFQPTQGGTITAQTGEWNRRGQAGRMVPDTEPYEPSDGI
ncbi:hypothetical protein QJQ45_002790 [Haematococcus lacustris]|nr:hypothetical protein QJQ45_002790 [Haematococcus lacustris]